MADFHALRHTFISNLARAGVHPRNAQAQARHSTIDLTMNTYSHVSMTDLSRDVESLPALGIAKEVPAIDGDTEASPSHAATDKPADPAAQPATAPAVPEELTGLASN